MNEIAAQLGGTAWTVVFFIIGLSVIIFVHEYGHYIVGRWSGIHAEVFSLGFGPILFSRQDRRGTRWQVAAIPFGGYVKFLGDADPSSVRPADVSGLSETEQRHTMAGAPLWARAATVFAGPLANFILAFGLYAGLILIGGVVREEPTVGRMHALPAAGDSLHEGDVILAIAGVPTPDWDGFNRAKEAAKSSATVLYTVRRDGAEVAVTGPHPNAVVVGQVALRSAALDAGIEAGDVILKAGGQDIRAFDELVAIVKASKGKPIPLTIWRGGKTFDLSLTPRLQIAPDNQTGELTERYMIGLISGLAFDPGMRTPSLWEVVTGASMTMTDMTVSMFAGLNRMIRGMISTCGFSGAIAIAETMGDAARIGIETFLTVLAGLSLGIGIMNLFPIPVLDGGHLMFHAYEALARRKPSPRVLNLLMAAGLSLVIFTMLFALSRDLVCG